MRVVAVTDIEAAGYGAETIDTVLATATSYTIHPLAPELANCVDVELEVFAVDAVGNLTPGGGASSRTF